MTLAVVLMATEGSWHLRNTPTLIASIRKFFPPCDVILFTDSKEWFDAKKVYRTNEGWPRVTLMRFHALLEQKNLLASYDQVLYLDTDMLVCSKIEEEEVTSPGIVAVQHPSYPADFERNPNSTAYIKGDPAYYQGCLFGGAAQEVLKMSAALARKIDIDQANGLCAIWYDESYLNRYLLDCPPAKVLSPAYCFPRLGCLRHTERWLTSDLGTFVPKIRHLYKGNLSLKNEADVARLMNVGKQHDALIAIASCHKQRHFEDAQRETWIQDIPSGVDYKFFLGNPVAGDAKADEVFLDVPDDYKALGRKMNATFRWALDQGYQHIYKCDLDTLVNPQNLLSSGFEKYDYMGGLYNHNPNQKAPFASGGAGYWLSKNAMQLLVDADLGDAEDLSIGRIMDANGIVLHGDDRYKYLPGALLDKDTVSFHLSSVYGWTSKYNTSRMFESYQAVRQEISPRATMQSLWIGSVNTMVQLSVASYLANGHPYHLYTYGSVDGNLPNGVEVKDGNAIVPESDIKLFKTLGQFSDWFRLNLLLKRGGWWVDADSVCLKPFDFPTEEVYLAEEKMPKDDLNVLTGLLRPEDLAEIKAGFNRHHFPGNGNLKAPAGSPVIQWMVDEAEKLRPEWATMPWATIGPALAWRAADKFNITVQPHEDLLPILGYNANDLVKPGLTLPATSHAVHFYYSGTVNTPGGFDVNGRFPSTCIYEQLKRRYNVPRFKIVIPSRSQSKVTSCVSSVLACEPDLTTADFIIVDDGAKTDSSVLALQGVHWVKGIKPFVYSRNVNLGIREADSDVLLLNDDVRISTFRGLTKLAELARAHPEYAVIGPALTQGPPKELKQTDGDLRSLDTLIGFVSVFITKVALQEIGVLDERFIGYGWEDWDWCRRARRAGFKCGCYDGVVVEHNVVPSTFRDEDKDLWKKRMDLSIRVYKDKWKVHSEMEPVVPKPIAPKSVPVIATTLAGMSDWVLLNLIKNESTPLANRVACVHCLRQRGSPLAENAEVTSLMKVIEGKA